MNPAEPMREYQVWEARFPGPDGVALTSIGGGKYVATYADGSCFERHLTDYLFTEDGVAWNPMMLRGPNPLPLVCCRRCRQPSLFSRPRMGLVTAAGALRCAGCFAFVCPRHARMSPDGHIRCVACARTFRAKESILSIFYESE